MVKIKIDIPWDHIGLLAEIAKRAVANRTTHRIGRTAMMKYLYFLQTIRNVHLGYHFTLYSYGPYDSAVLGHLDYAEMFGAVKSSVVNHPGGYGYRIECDGDSPASRFVTEHTEDIDWVLTEFADYNSGQLELASTIVFADREVGSCKKQGVSDLVNRVSEIKPRFSKETISDEVEKLRTKNVLTSLQESSVT